MSLNIPLIRASFDEIKPYAYDAVTLFYKNLFDKYPELKTLFAKTNIENQKNALIASLVKIVDNIDKPETLIPYLKSMGERHVRYGVRTEHYSMVADSLMTTFRHFFGRIWDSQLEDQWSIALGVVAEQMLDGAKTAGHAPINPAKVTELPHAAISDKHDSAHDLSNTVRQLAKHILIRALEQELDEEFLRIAKKKAAQILNQAIREEAESLQEQFNSKKKAS